MKSVEFIGYPGAGKTSMVQHMRRAARLSGLRLMDNPRAEYMILRAQMPQAIRAMFPSGCSGGGMRRLARMVSPMQDDLHAYGRFLRAHPRYEAVLLETLEWSIARTSHPHGVFSQAKKMFDLAMTYQRIVEIGGYDIFCLDPGFFTRVTSFFAFADADAPQDMVFSYFDSMPRPDAVFVLDVTPEQAAIRMERRRRGAPTRFTAIDAAGRDAIIGRMGCLIGMLPVYAETRHIPLIRVDMDKPLDAIAADAIQTLMRQGSRP